MGLIIKDKIAQLRKGYPTVSDKYNVQGGIYVGDGALLFGDILAYSGTTGHYVKLEDDTIEAIAGICLATNVKLANRYPGDSNSKVETLPGEAFNLLVRGFVAVEIEDATLAAAVAAYEASQKTAADKATFEAAKATAIASIEEGAPVYLAEDGKFTATGTDAVPGVFFMGVAEIIGNELVAEINYKM